MTIRPMDLQVLMPRVQEVGKNQHLQNQQEQMAQQHFASELKHQSERHSHQVLDSEKTEGQNIKEHEKRQHSGNSSREQNCDTSSEEHSEELAKDPKLGNVLDIKV